MWMKKEPWKRGPAEDPSYPPGPQPRFVPEERIEVVRKVANSREERDWLKAELESQGFTVMVRETSAPPVEGEYYTATLFAEKRETVMVDTRAVEREKLAQRKRDKKIDLTAKLGFWIVVVLALLGLLYLLGPLIHAIRALL
jgi:hypothetical protein